MFHSNIKGVEDFAVGKTIFQVIINGQRKIESHATPCQPWDIEDLTASNAFFCSVLIDTFLYLPDCSMTEH